MLRKFSKILALTLWVLSDLVCANPIAQKPILVVDAGGTHLRVALWDKGRLMDMEKTLSPNIHQALYRSKNPKMVQKAWLDYLVTRIRLFQTRYPQVEGVSISFPGPVDSKQSMLRSNNLWGDLDKPIEKIEIERALGLPVSIAPDVICALKRYESLPQYSAQGRFSVLTIGTGMSIKLSEASCGQLQPGGGLGQVHVGGFKLEKVAAGAGFINLVHHLVKKPDEMRAFMTSGLATQLKNNHVSLPQATSSEFNHALFAALKQGDPYAQHILAESSAYLAAALEHYILAVSPKVIILTGGVPESLGEAYRQSLIMALQKHKVFGRTHRQLADLFVLGIGDGHDALIGAALLWQL